MKRNFVVLAAAATFAACGSVAPLAQGDGYLSAPVVSENQTTTPEWFSPDFDTVEKRDLKGTTMLLVGPGYIESIADLGDNERGAMAGPLRRIGVRMGDGRVQYLRTHAQNLAIGARVEITKDANIRYPAATSVPASSRG